MNNRLPLLRASAGMILACGTFAAGAAFGQVAGPQPAVPLATPDELSGNRGIDRRLDRDEQTLRDLRAIVLQAKASGKPVEVKDAGPDPALADMQSKLDDLTMTLSRLDGEVESLTHTLELTRKALADQADADKGLVDRIAKLEGQVQTLQTAAAPGLAAGAGAPPPPGAGSGVLGELPANAATPGAVGVPAAPVDEAAAYRQAREVLDTGDYASGAAALQDYLAKYPNSPRAPEANYWLGRTLALRDMHADAAAAYARSLRGWPQTAWAGDALVRLSVSLVELKRGDDACKALAEFDARYASRAATAVKARAKDARDRAACA